MSLGQAVWPRRSRISSCKGAEQGKVPSKDGSWAGSGPEGGEAGGEQGREGQRGRKFGLGWADPQRECGFYCK